METILYVKRVGDKTVELYRINHNQYSVLVWKEGVSLCVSYSKVKISFTDAMHHYNGLKA